MVVLATINLCACRTLQLYFSKDALSYDDLSDEYTGILLRAMQIALLIS